MPASGIYNLVAYATELHMQLSGICNTMTYATQLHKYAIPQHNNIDATIKFMGHAIQQLTRSVNISHWQGNEARVSGSRASFSLARQRGLR
jgi:hypothetical protein